MGKRLAAPLALGLAYLAAPPAAEAQPVPVTVVLQDGDDADGSTVTTVWTPVTNGLNHPAFLGTAADGRHFLWNNDDYAFFSNEETTLTLSLPSEVNQATIGIDNDGGFVYLPRTNPTVTKSNTLYLADGTVLHSEGDVPAPALDAPTRLDQLFRPRMVPDGTIFFIGEVDNDGGGSPDMGVLYKHDGTDTTIVIKAGDAIDDANEASTTILLDDDSIGKEYDVSDNGEHYIVRVQLVPVAPAGDDALVVDGAVVVQEDATAAERDDDETDYGLFDDYKAISINNEGNYIFTGDTVAGNDYLGFNGKVTVIEGDEDIDGLVLPNNSAINGASLNNWNMAVHLWRADTDGPSGPQSADDHLFFACDAADALSSSQLILAVDQEVDVDGDGVADAVVEDIDTPTFNSIGTPLFLGDGYTVYAKVDLNYGEGIVEAIIGIPVSCCGNAVVDPEEECDDGDDSVDCNLDCTPSECGDGHINNAAGEECDDEGESAQCDADCTVPECGDGTLNTAAGEQCDGAGESATCNFDCTTSMCGDGTVNGTAGEDCDEGGTESAGCDLDCSYPSCGDGTVNTAAGESCDDSGESATCDSDCSATQCGDGVLNRTAGEQCEDGNTTAGDGCSSTCQIEGGDDTTSTTGDAPAAVEDDGCGCRAAGAPTRNWGGAALALLAGLVGLRRRRTS